MPRELYNRTQAGEQLRQKGINRQEHSARMFDPIFPGMDPFIEGVQWPAFHSAMITRIQNELSRLLVPRCEVRIESYDEICIRPLLPARRRKPNTKPLGASYAPITQPTRIITPTFSEESAHKRVDIRDEEGKLITVVELLSPACKNHHRDRYLANRDAVLLSDVHLIEIDLLRGGERMEPDTPVEGFVILVARSQPRQPHRGELYEIGLRDPLPVIPVPLKPGDVDAPLDLPTLFKQVYIAAHYRTQLDYTQPPTIPFQPDDAAWIQSVLEKRAIL